MRSQGSFDNARKIMTELVEKTCSDVDEYIPDHPYRYFLKELAWFGIRRQQ